MFDGVRHYPIGLLHDLFMYTDENTRRTPLPWRINIRLTNFPTDKLLRSPSVEAAQDAFMSMIKEVKPYTFFAFYSTFAVAGTYAGCRQIFFDMDQQSE